MARTNFGKKAESPWMCKIHLRNHTLFIITVHHDLNPSSPPTSHPFHCHSHFTQAPKHSKQPRLFRNPRRNLLHSLSQPKAMDSERRSKQNQDYEGRRNAQVADHVAHLEKRHHLFAPRQPSPTAPANSSSNASSDSANSTKYDPTHIVDLETKA